MVGRYVALVVWGMAGGFAAVAGAANYRDAAIAWWAAAVWASGWCVWEAIDLIRVRAAAGAPEVEHEDLVVTFVAPDSGEVDIDIEVHR